MDIQCGEYIEVKQNAASDIKEKINNLKKKEWSNNLRCISTYIDMYKSQIMNNNDVQYMSKKQELIELFPFPMFEYRIKCGNCDNYNTHMDQISIVNKGMSMNFHVMYAEIEILKLLIDN